MFGGDVHVFVGVGLVVVEFGQDDVTVPVPPDHDAVTRLIEMVIGSAVIQDAIAAEQPDRGELVLDRFRSAGLQAAGQRRNGCFR